METVMNDTEQKSVVVLVGLPGSGKSTARARAAELGAAASSYHYSTDDLIEAVASAQGTTYAEVFETAIPQATAQADREVKQAIANGQGVIWDQTNMNVKKRGKILKKFDDSYRKVCVCMLPPHTALQQIELERRLKSREGKHIPKFVMANMLKSFVLPSTQEGFDQIFYFDIYGKMVEPEHAQELFTTA
jgi:predicted kinase